MIKNKLKTIEENIELVRENFPNNLDDFLDLGLVKDGIYKRIDSSIQEILNVCSIINTDLDLVFPQKEMR
ncbi:MAG: hypothetical protein EU542_07310 [Promethearchaeota archaeon]|nr:MAG: hypothetical protein EU542_07310 [Candidatus Lokiarchaeota archaeon]